MSMVMLRQEVGKNSVGRGMAQKRRENGMRDADDMKNEICYADTVYKWVQMNLLFYFQ